MLSVISFSNKTVVQFSHIQLPVYTEGWEVLHLLQVDTCILSIYCKIYNLNLSRDKIVRWCEGYQSIHTALCQLVRLHNHNSHGAGSSSQSGAVSSPGLNGIFFVFILDRSQTLDWVVW